MHTDRRTHTIMQPGRDKAKQFFSLFGVPFGVCGWMTVRLIVFGVFREFHQRYFQSRRLALTTTETLIRWPKNVISNCCYPWLMIIFSPKVKGFMVPAFKCQDSLHFCVLLYYYYWTSLGIWQFARQNNLQTSSWALVSSSYRLLH